MFDFCQSPVAFGSALQTLQGVGERSDLRLAECRLLLSGLHIQVLQFLGRRPVIAQLIDGYPHWRERERLKWFGDHFVPDILWARGR